MKETFNFEGALTALKNGKLIRSRGWRNEFVVLVAAHDLSTEIIPAGPLKHGLNASGAVSLHDFGNFRRFDLDNGTVINGWLPALADLLTEDWTEYDPLDVAHGQMDRRMQELIRRGDANYTLIAENLSAQLTDLDIDFITGYTAGTERLDLKLEGAYEGILVTVEDGGYVVYVGESGPDEATASYWEVGGGHIEAEVTRAHEATTPQSSRQFYHTDIRVQVLSEDPIPDGATLQEIVNGMFSASGDYVGQWSIQRASSLDGRQAVLALKEFGSDPSLFRLTDTGADADDAWY